MDTKESEELDLPRFSNGYKKSFSIQALTPGVNRVVLRAGGNNIVIGVHASFFCLRHQAACQTAIKRGAAI